MFDFDFSADAYSRCFRDLLGGNEITAGQDLGGTGYTSLNVQGVSGSKPTTWLTVYDASWTGRGALLGPQTLCADVLIVPFNNAKGVGVVALLNEGAGQERVWRWSSTNWQHGQAVPRHGERRPGARRES